MRFKSCAFAFTLLCLMLLGVAPAVADAPPAFTPVPIFDTGMGMPGSAAYSPDGRFLAVSNVTAETGGVITYTVGDDGTLTPAGEAVDVADNGGVTFSPDGGLLVELTPGSTFSEVRVYKVSSIGTLMPVDDATAGAEAIQVVFSPDGHLLATVNYFSDTVSMFTVGADGTLTHVGDYSTGSGTTPMSVAFSPDGHLLATANARTSTVTVFTVGAGGVLSTASTTSTGSTTSPGWVAFSPDGYLLATANTEGDIANPDGTEISVFSVAAGGNLTAVPQSGDAGFLNGSRTGAAVAFSPDGHLLAAADNNDTVQVFGIGADGTLAPNPDVFETTGGEQPEWMGFSPVGGTLAVLDGNNVTSQIETVSMFSYPIAPPTAAIAEPPAGSSFTVGQTVATSFSCADSEFGTGITSCIDSNGAAGGIGALNTSAPGTFTYTITARSRDGQTGSASLTYTVAAPTPTTPPTTPTLTTPPTTPTPTPHPPKATPKPVQVRISGVRLSKPTVAWCRHCTYPSTNLRFKLSARANVRLQLQARVNRHFKRVATTTIHGKKGANSFRVGRHWHRLLKPGRSTRILVQLKPGRNWTTRATRKLTVRQRPVT